VRIDRADIARIDQVGRERGPGAAVDGLAVVAGERRRTVLGADGGIDHPAPEGFGRGGETATGIANQRVGRATSVLGPAGQLLRQSLLSGLVGRLEHQYRHYTPLSVHGYAEAVVADTVADGADSCDTPVVSIATTRNW